MCAACLKGYYSIMGWRGNTNAPAFLLTPMSGGPLTATVGADRRVGTHRTLTKAAGHRLIPPLGPTHRGSGSGERPEHPYRPGGQSHQQPLPGRRSSLAHKHGGPDGTGQPQGKHTRPVPIKIGTPDVLRVPSSLHSSLFQVLQINPPRNVVTEGGRGNYLLVAGQTYR